MGKERPRVRKRELMISDFLGAVTEVFVFALILVSWFPRIISMNLLKPVAVGLLSILIQTWF